MLTVYVLKNRVGRYNIFFFYFYTQLAESSFLCRFRVESVNVFVLPWFDLSNFLHQQFRTCANAFPNEFTVRSYEYCASQHGILYWMQENQTATYFLRSTYLCMILLKMSTAISIKHRILATFYTNNMFWTRSQA